MTGYGVGGLSWTCPPGPCPALVEWTLVEAHLGAKRLHGSGRDADALLVLTEAARSSPRVTAGPMRLWTL
ncbi:hypothetical protein [Streptomyces sp. NPDC017086]|uniref:hypothetical protein n=1 Tax=Streptomyces sp. NPDC017086 TaxID=3364976 RepID=UPI0037998F04